MVLLRNVVYVPLSLRFYVWLGLQPLMWVLPHRTALIHYGAVFHFNKCIGINSRKLTLKSVIKCCQLTLLLCMARIAAFNVGTATSNSPTSSANDIQTSPSGMFTLPDSLIVIIARSIPYAIVVLPND